MNFAKILPFNRSAVLLLAVLISCGTPARLSRQEAETEAIWTYSQSHPEGFTVDVRTTATPEEGICAAYAATQGRHSRADLDFVVSHSLENDGYVGGWWNSEDSLYYFDSIRIFPESEREEAYAFGRENGQEAVYVLSTGEEIRLTRMVRPHEEEPSGLQGKPTVFLAGTIDNGKADDWQERAAFLLDGKGKGYILYNPRQKDWNPGREGEMDYQVGWELDHLEKADYILMNFLPGSSSPITLLELGLLARSGKILVVCPPGFYRYDNVRITCRRYGVPLFPTLEEAIDTLP